MTATTSGLTAAAATDTTSTTGLIITVVDISLRYEAACSGGYAIPTDVIANADNYKGEFRVPAVTVNPVTGAYSFQIQVTANNTFVKGSVSSDITNVTIDNGSGKKWTISGTAKKCETDLYVSKKLNSSTLVDPGSNVSWTITVGNNGPQNSSASTVTDVLPAGYTFVSATPTGCTNVTGSATVTCLPGALAVGASKSFVITAKAPDSGACLANTATVVAKETDPNTTAAGSQNTSTSAAVCIKQAIIDVAKTATGVTGPDAAGNYVASYTVIAKNSTTVTGKYSLSDTLAFDPNLVVSKIDWSINGAAQTALTSQSSWTLATNRPLSGGATDTYLIKVTYSIADVDKSVGSCGLKNTISGGFNDDPSNNQACQNAPEPAAAKLTLDKTAKTVSALNPATGTFTATYDVTLTNTGVKTGSFGNIVDTPSFGAGVAIDSITWTGKNAAGASTSGTGGQLASAGSLAGGKTMTWTVTVTFHYTGSTTPGACSATGGGLVNTVAFDTTKDDACLDAPAAPKASLSLDKKAGEITNTNVDTRVNAGDTIAYTFEVKNTGDLTLNDVKVIDDKVPGVSCPKTTLAPGESMTCTATYTIVQSDMDAKNVHNNATATGTAPSGIPVTPGKDFDDKPLTPVDAIQIVKTITGKTNVADQFLTYSFTVTNTGTSTLTNVVITDATLKQTVTIAELLPNVPVTVTKDAAGNDFAHKVTQDEIDSGSFTNYVQVTSTGANGPAKHDTSATYPFETGTPTIDLTKTASAIVNKDADVRHTVGDEITYTFTIKNTSMVTLKNILLTDDLVGWKAPGVTCGETTLLPGKETSCTAVYKLTQADIDAGNVHNDAVVNALAPKDKPVSDADKKDVPVVQDPNVSIVKSASAVKDVDGNGHDAGDTIAYSFLVTNTGNVTLHDVIVKDTRIGFEHVIGELKVGEPVTVPFTYTLLQSDIDVASKTLVNKATVDSKETPEVPSNEVTTPVAGKTALSVVKEHIFTKGDPTAPRAGDEVTYTFTITNQGTTTLTSLSVTDKVLGLVGDTALTQSGLNIPPTKTYAFTAKYTLTQADIDKGELVNIATANGSSVVGTADPKTGTDTIVFKAPGDLTLVKEHGTVVDAALPAGQSAGDTVAYTFTISNPSTKTVSGLTLTDNKLGLTEQKLTSDLCSTLTLDGKAVASVDSLAPNSTLVCVAKKLYTLLEADFNTGSVTNDASVDGVDPQKTPIHKEKSSTLTLEQKASYTFKKTYRLVDANENGRVDAGEDVIFTFTVKNTGNTTLTNITVEDKLLGLNKVIIDKLTADQERAVDAAAYPVSQAQIDAGGFTNEATATATPPTGVTVKPVPADVQVPLDPKPSLSIVKSAKVNDLVRPDGKVEADETVTYTFTVTNTGNVTLKNIGINDPTLLALGVKASDIVCDTTELAPDLTKVATCKATLTITQKMVDDAAAGTGIISNVATASGLPPKSETPVESKPSNPADVTVVSERKLELDKSAAFADPAKRGVGDKVIFTFTVTNKGDVTIKDLAIVDAMLDKLGKKVTCQSTTLTPKGATSSTTCTSDPYEITQDDVDKGIVENKDAYATGKGPKADDVKSNFDSDHVMIPRTGTLQLIKQAKLEDANKDGVANAGEKIFYSFVITNDTNVRLTAPTVTDEKLGLKDLALTAEVCEFTPAFDGTLLPNSAQPITCTLKNPYTVSQTDIDSGSQILNVATASAKDPQGKQVDSGKAETSTDNSTKASLALVKTAKVTDVDGNGFHTVGDTVVYSFEVTNTGERTLHKIEVLDPMLSQLGIAVTCDAKDLAPGAKALCTSAKYTLTAADAAQGVVTNTATVRGSSKDQDVTSEKSTVDIPVAEVIIEGQPDPEPEPGKPNKKAPVKTVPLPAVRSTERQLADTGGH